MKRGFTLCPYCGCGCSLLVEARNAKIKILPDLKDPVSRGKPCIKGLTSYELVHSSERIKLPLIRINNQLIETNWEYAYEFIKKNIKKIKPYEIAFYISSPATNEDSYLFQKFAGEVFKSNNIDSCARVCHASTCYALNKVFGIDCMPSKLDDFVKADLILITGTNPKVTYPVAFDKIKKAKSRGAKIICINDWKDETCKEADLYVEIKEGTQIAFFNCLLHYLNSRLPKQLKNILKNYTKEKTSEICGCTEKEIEKVISLVKISKKFLLCYGMDLSQHVYGVENVFSVCNLVIAKNGKIVPMRGKVHIQAVADMGCLPKNGGDTITSSIFLNPLKVLYLINSNPAQSLPELNLTHKKLNKLFIIQHTAFPNETTKYANVVLPNCLPIETSGTFTNAESRIRYFDKVIHPLINVKPNWLIIKELARHFKKQYFYETPLDILGEIKRNIPGYKQININKLKNHESQFADKRIKYKKYQLAQFTGLQEKTSKFYPYILTTERQMYNFCTNDLSEYSKTLKKLSPEPYALISKEDAKKLALKDNSLIEINSKVGSIKIKSKILDEVPKNLVIVPFHFREVLVNKLIPLEFSPIVEEPNLKRVAVNIRKL